MSYAIPYLIPWFLVHHPKPRLVVNCKELNSCRLEPPYVRLPGWNQTYPFLERGMFGAKLDLLSSSHTPVPRKVFNHLSGRRCVSIPSFPVRTTYDSVHMGQDQARLRKALAVKRYSCVHLPQRYPHPGKKPLHLADNI